ncbi:hypothetical protein [Pseudoduganella sp. UC29_71]|uniref:hypothetical protein n=1 Tax=Pseudoduganella sp. UC29_71 TaxID=3350174 RepID=UPI00366C5560
MLAKTPTQEAVVMWCACAAEEVCTAGEVAERIHSGAVYSSKQEAWAEAESMCQALGSAGLWFGAKRTVVSPAQGGGHAR